MYIAPSLSSGYRFNYWKDKKEEQETYNIHNESIEALTIDMMHPNYKEEILNTNYFDVEDWDGCVTKCNMYMQTEYIKEMKANYNRMSGKHYIRPEHYGIISGSAIKHQHILSVLFYTDYSAFSTAFSASFRRTSPQESLLQIKQRNQRFWWGSKFLRETVELWGQSGNEIGDKHLIAESGKSRFFTGLKAKMFVKEFSIRFAIPTSTTRLKQIAINFAKGKGILLALSNKEETYSAFVRGFDVSYLSAFNNEEEVYVIYIFVSMPFSS